MPLNSLVTLACKPLMPLPCELGSISLVIPKEMDLQRAGILCPPLSNTWKASGLLLWATFSQLWAALEYSGLFFWATWRSRYGPTSDSIDCSSCKLHDPTLRATGRSAAMRASPACADSRVEVSENSCYATGRLAKLPCSSPRLYRNSGREPPTSQSSRPDSQALVYASPSQEAQVFRNLSWKPEGRALTL